MTSLENVMYTMNPNALLYYTILYSKTQRQEELDAFSP